MKNTAIDISLTVGCSLSPHCARAEHLLLLLPRGGFYCEAVTGSESHLSTIHKTTVEMEWFQIWIPPTPFIVSCQLNEVNYLHSAHREIWFGL